MLESHNDSAVLVAENVAGSVQEFAVEMNKKAKEIGCKDTHFVTPNGLDGTDEKGAHRTTAEDHCTDFADIASQNRQNENSFLRLHERRCIRSRTSSRQGHFPAGIIMRF